MTETQTHTAEAGDVTTRGWLLEGATVYTLIKTGRMYRGSPVMRNENWFQVQGPDAEAVAARIHNALAASPAPRAPAVPEELRRLSEAATPGEWRFSSKRMSGDCLITAPDRVVACIRPWTMQSVDDRNEADASFIAALVNAFRSGTLAAAPAAPPTDGGTEGLREALEFYASPASYALALEFGQRVPVLVDNGDTARAALSARAEGAGDSVAELDPVMKPGQGPLDTQASPPTPAGAAGDPVREDEAELVARTIYAAIPNGGLVRFPTTMPDPSYEKRFVADTWEEAPDRHDECRRIARLVLDALATRPASPAPAASAEIARWLQDRIVAAEQARDAYPDNSEKGAVLDGAIGALASVITFVRSAPDAALAPAVQVNPGRTEIAWLRMHLKDAANVFDTTAQRLRFGSLPGTQRREIADECASRARQFRDALERTDGFPSECKDICAVAREDGDGTPCLDCPADAILAARPVAVGDAEAMREACATHLECVADLTEANSRGGLGSMFASQSASDLRREATRIRALPVPPAARPAPSPAKGGNGA